MVAPQLHIEAHFRFRPLAHSRHLPRHEGLVLLHHPCHGASGQQRMIFAAHESPSAIGAALRDGLQRSCPLEPAMAGKPGAQCECPRALT